MNSIVSIASIKKYYFFRKKYLQKFCNSEKFITFALAIEMINHGGGTNHESKYKMVW